MVIYDRSFIMSRFRVSVWHEEQLRSRIYIMNNDNYGIALLICCRDETGAMNQGRLLLNNSGSCFLK
jgi:hypothetical protein